MKNLKLLFLVALMCGFALNSTAQSVTSDYETDWTYYTMCEGVLDIISGPVHVKQVNHYNPKTGVLEWFKWSIHSDELVSLFTGEVFSVNSFHKSDHDPNVWLDGTFRYNLRGDQGTHVLVTIIWTYDADTGTYIRTKRTAVCL